MWFFPGLSPRLADLPSPCVLSTVFFCAHEPLVSECPNFLSHYKDTHQIGLGDPCPSSFIVKLIASLKAQSLQSYFEVLGVRASTYTLGVEEYSSVHNKHLRVVCLFIYLVCIFFCASHCESHACFWLTLTVILDGSIDYLPGHIVKPAQPIH